MRPLEPVIARVPTGPPPVRRLLGGWWRRQSPARQDRLATLAPLASVVLFLAAIVTAFWYLRNEELEHEQQTVQRDAEVAQQVVGQRLRDNQEQLALLARELLGRSAGPVDFRALASRYARERPEVAQLLWLDATRAVQGVFQPAPFAPGEDERIDTARLPLPDAAAPNAPEAAFAAARERRRPAYSPAYRDAFGGAAFQLHVPLFERGAFAGTLAAEYSAEGLLHHVVPSDVKMRRALSLLDERGQRLVGTVQVPPEHARSRPASIVHALPLAPADNGMQLRSEGHRTSIGLIGNTLFWMVVLLSVLTVWMLLGTWRHMRRRLQMQSALVSEANFRRAMENSMLTGMRAMDLEGRITYVNPAFCAMTGFSEAEIVGRRPPFPYWPPDRQEENNRLLQQELQGRSPAGGIEVKVMRKDGTRFDSRMYVSPLIDARGQQTGWMTSMTNITEAKRVRDQLTASHERFTTVLEGLDAAVSVVSAGEGKLLFANRSYRVWFGSDAAGHTLLAGADGQAAAPLAAEDLIDGPGVPAAPTRSDAAAGTREVYVEPLQKWFDVRERELQWTDGRPTRMLIATDITARRNAEALAASQAEKAEVTSRLVTMGEMASSVAHELNQPLTAITNYCNGMVDRVRADVIGKDDLIAALEKTARQAQRAGQTIHRIRAFVKRSEPQRQAAQARQIVEDAVELAGIELRRRNVTIQTYVAQRLPPLWADPILVEQVLLNLLKNAAEAIDSAKLPRPRRSIELRVVPRETPEEGEVIEFAITDGGPGIREEVRARLYEAFFSTKPEGLGIGLSLCRSIVESHHGRIGAENLYNGQAIVGCRFTFTLPVLNSPADAPAARLAALP